MADSSSPISPPVGRHFARSKTTATLDTIPCSPDARVRRTTSTHSDVSKEGDRGIGIGTPVRELPSSTTEEEEEEVIEVPASSPIETRSRLGLRIAPAGTVFRPPVGAPNLISLLSDDDDDDGENGTLQSSRGDIRPMDFRQRVSAFTYKPKKTEEEEEGEKNRLARVRQVLDVMGDKVSTERAREALKECLWDVEDTVDLLEEQERERRRKKKTGLTKAGTGGDLSSSEVLALSKLKEVYDVLGDRFTSERVREALRRCEYDVKDTIRLLQGQEQDKKRKRGPVAEGGKGQMSGQMVRRKIIQVHDILGDRFTSKKVSEALKTCDYDVNDTIQLLEDLEQDKKRIKGPPAKAHKSSFGALKTSVDKPMLGRKITQVRDVVGDGFRSDKVREALETCDYDVEDTIELLRELGHKKKGRTGKDGRLGMKVSKHFSPRKLSSSPMPSCPTSPPLPSSPSSPTSPSSLPPDGSPELIVIEDDTDEYEKVESEDEVGDCDRVLDTINESTLEELAAMTGLKESLLEPIIEHRPFADLHSARKVSAKKSGSRKGGRNIIGETVVDAVQVFLTAITAIDEVVATCEAKARTVKSVMDTWDLDHFGHSKNRKTPDVGAPPTPNSFSSFVPPLVPQQPALMDGHCQMKPFQLFGLNWMTLLNNYDIGCILADEMGLGKTCQVISFICHMVETAGDGRPWPNLVVVPPSTYNNWLIEFGRFAPGLSVIGYRGSQPERAEIAYEVERNADAYHVVLATYSQINSETDLGAMQSFQLNAAIFDEGHKMKNPDTKIYKDLSRIPAAWKMLLTGTPVQNNLLEMTALLNFINPRLFQGYMDHIQYIFSQKVTIRDITNGAFLYSERVRRARNILEPFILQRRKDQVLRDLPRKTCRVVHCDMTEEQAALYAEYEELFKKAPQQRKSSGRQNDQNNVWMQLRKAALHPLLFRRHFSDETTSKMARMLMERVPQSELHQPDLGHLTQELRNASDFELHLWCRDYPFLQPFDLAGAGESELRSGKVETLLRLIGEYEAGGDRVLVFSKFARVVELLQEVLARRGTRHLALMGQTNVSERQALIDEFNGGDVTVFLLTTGAGGTGINLTRANKVVLFDQSDNPQEDIQAENRAHRLGQRRDVEVVRLVSRGTVEELVYRACQKKIELADKVTAGEGGDGRKEMEAEVRRMMGE